MTGLRWDESLETGDQLVDQQHRNIHALVDYVEASKDEPDLRMRVLERLMEHVDCHFTTEETLMASTGYVGPEADGHVIEHRKLTADARDVVLKFRCGELTDMEPVVAFLRGWLAEHVHERDRRFIDYVRAQGASATLPEPWASDPLPLTDQVA